MGRSGQGQTVFSLDTAVLVSNRVTQNNAIAKVNTIDVEIVIDAQAEGYLSTYLTLQGGKQVDLIRISINYNCWLGLHL